MIWMTTLASNNDVNHAIITLYKNGMEIMIEEWK